MRTRTERIVALSIFFAVVLVGVTIQGEASPLAPPDAHSSRWLESASAPATETLSMISDNPSPCESGDCSAAIPVTCNSVFTWYNEYGNQWETYDCLDTDIFPSLPYSEALYSLSVPTDSLDIGLRLLATAPGEGAFGALLNGCDNEHCQAAAYYSYEINLWRDAVVADAATGVYTIVIDSPDMRGGGGAQIACGDHETGWCEDVVSATLPCGTYTIHDNTRNGRNRVVYYGPDGDDENWFYDGRELVYKIVLTQTSLVSGTLYYSGNPDRLLDQYMSVFILDEACDQRSWVADSDWAGEQGETSASGNAIGFPGTYYVIVDGVDMPNDGDAFSMDILCIPLHPAFMPTVLKNL